MDKEDVDRRYLQRDFSIGSEQELDNLQNIKSLDSSYNIGQSPNAINDKMFSGGNPFGKPGDTDPPHRFRREREDNVSDGFEYDHEVTQLDVIGENNSTPVRKLKSKQSGDQLLEREYSDAYLDAISRTPRYKSGSSYQEMYDNLHEDDPFHQPYVPSDKPPRRKSKKAKSSSSKNTDKSTEDGSEASTIKKSKKLKKKSSKLTESTGSTGTYTIEGHTNLGMSKEMDSTGTYTVENSVPSQNGNVNASSGIKTFTDMRRSTKHKGKMLGKDSFRSFVRENDIKERTGPSEKRPCSSFGEVKFQGYRHDTESSLYIRVDKDTDPEIILRLMVETWNLPLPNLLLSITGGAQRFLIKQKLLEKFKFGLLNAANSTGAWILTGGTKTGVMEMVGEAVHEYSLGRGLAAHELVCIGIATWGKVCNREALVAKANSRPYEGMFPAIYSKHDVENSEEKSAVLDHNHTHFVLVDDGSNKYGGEIKFRADLESRISEIACGPSNTDTAKMVKTPLIQILVEGGIGSMETVYETVERSNPVLVLQGSGRTADFIAIGYNYTKSLRDDDKPNFPADFDEHMKTVAEQLFEFGKNDKQKDEKIKKSVKQLRIILNKRNLISVFGLSDVEVKFDKAILRALLKAKKSEVSAQLSLALAWNRSDIAKNEIFGTSRKLNHGEMRLRDAMVVALVQGRHEFVKLFLDNGIELKDFLTKENLWNLYKSCLSDKSDGAADLLNNLITHNQGLFNILEHSDSDPLIHDVGKVIVDLMDNEAFNPYANHTFDVDCKKVGGSRMEYIDRINGEEKVIDFEEPERELFYWALLLNRIELATLFWRIGKNHIGGALTAAALLKALSDKADDEEELELSNSFSENSAYFETLACESLSHCYNQNKILAQQLLIRKLKNYGDTTLFMLADSAGLMNFTDQTCCQTKLNSVWKGMMALYTSWWKIIVCMFLPIFIPTIKFISNKDPSEELSAEYDSLEEEMNKEALMDGAHSAKVAPEKDESAEKKKRKRKLFSVTFFRGRHNISVFTALYYFYTAPVTKFSFHIIAYLVYLALFTFFVLTDLRPYSYVESESPSVYEYVVWGWTVTMAMEEIRQIITREQRTLLNKIKGWLGSGWNMFDLVMYLLFAFSVILRLTLDKDRFQYVRLVYSITLAMFYVRIMQAFFVEKNIGPKVIMIRKMVTDLLFFFAILVVFVFSFGTVYQANLFPNALPSWRLLKNVVYMPYWQIFGDPALDNAEGNLPEECTYNETIWRSGAMEQCAEKTALVPLTVAVYMLLTNILLVNLLIAMFSDTFQKVQENSLKVWRFHKLSLVYEFYERPTFVPPLIIMNHIFRMVRYLASKTCCKDLKYHDNFRKKFPDKEDEQLGQFEKQAVETHLYEIDKKAKEELSYKVSGTAERLDMVIDELENIKESFAGQSSRERILREGPDVTPRDVHALTARSSSGLKTGILPLEEQVHQLSNFVKTEMSAMAEVMLNMQRMLEENARQHQRQKTSLDIHQFGTSDS